MEEVVMKTSGRRREKPTRSALRALPRVALEAACGAIVCSVFDALEEREMGKHFDVVFVAVKTYALTAVKRAMDEASGVRIRRLGPSRPPGPREKSSTVMPQESSETRTSKPGVGRGYDIHEELG